jgi:regulator of protease activity HflC (stomatin/prohibitin superfamily)
MKGSGASELLEIVNVEAGHNGVWFRDGAYQATLGPGAWVFWKGTGRLKVVDVDLREQTLDISGQEIMTADKVTLRLNALVVYRVTDPLRSVAEVDGVGQALYRAAQLALREIVGARELDVLLVSKEALATELSELTSRAHLPLNCRLSRSRDRRGDRRLSDRILLSGGHRPLGSVGARVARYSREREPTSAVAFR